MKEYRLYWTFTARSLVVAFPIFMLFSGLISVVASSLSEENKAPILFLVSFMAFAVFVTIQSWRMPTRIRVSDDGKVQFKAWLRTFEIGVGEIESIKPNGGTLAVLVVNTRRGKIRILNQFDGFHDFLAHVKKLNPSVELRGC